MEKKRAISPFLYVFAFIVSSAVYLPVETHNETMNCDDCGWMCTIDSRFKNIDRLHWKVLVPTQFVYSSKLWHSSKDSSSCTRAVLGFQLEQEAVGK